MSTCQYLNSRVYSSTPPVCSTGRGKRHILEGTTPIQAFLRQIAWIPTYSSVDQDDGIEETLVAIARAAHLPTFLCCQKLVAEIMHVMCSKYVVLCVEELFRCSNVLLTGEGVCKLLLSRYQGDDQSCNAPTRLQKNPAQTSRYAGN